MSRRGIVLSVCALALALVAGARAVGGAASAVRTRACPQLGANWRCRTLVVPLDRSGRTPGTVRLAVAEWHRPGPRRAAVMAFSGGPGGAGIPGAARYRALLKPLLGDRDLILFDQRGTGVSAPLSCPRISGRETFPTAAVRACGRRLGARGAYFSSADSAADAEAVRRALGSPRVVLYGVSYGTKTAADYARRYPRAVRGMVLDSVVVQDTDPLYRRSAVAAARILRELCTDVRCATDPVRDLTRIIARMRDGALRARVARRSVDVTEARLLAAIVAGGATRRRLPAALHAAASGRFGPLAAVLPARDPRFARRPVAARVVQRHDLPGHDVRGRELPVEGERLLRDPRPQGGGLARAPALGRLRAVRQARRRVVRLDAHVPRLAERARALERRSAAGRARAPALRRRGRADPARGRARGGGRAAARAARRRARPRPRRARHDGARRPRARALGPRHRVGARLPREAGLRGGEAPGAEPDEREAERMRGDVERPAPERVAEDDVAAGDRGGVRARGHERDDGHRRAALEPALEAEERGRRDHRGRVEPGRAEGTGEAAAGGGAGERLDRHVGGAVEQSAREPERGRAAGARHERGEQRGAGAERGQPARERGGGERRVARTGAQAEREQDEREHEQHHGGELAAADALPREARGERDGEREAAGDEGLHQRERRRGERADVHGPARHPGERPGRPPARGEQAAQRGERSARGDPRDRGRAAVLEHVARVQGDGGGQREREPREEAAHAAPPGWGRTTGSGPGAHAPRAGRPRRGART